MFSILVTALFYWSLINLVTIPLFVYFVYGHDIHLGGYSQKIKLTIVEYLVPYQLGGFNAVAWTVLFAPFLEEIVFFGVPSLFGHPYIIMGLVAWSIVHIGRIAYGVRYISSTFRYLGAVISYTLFITLNGCLHLYLWTNGYGAVSIALHSLNNALVILGSYIMITRKSVESRRKFWIRS